MHERTLDTDRNRLARKSAIVGALGGLVLLIGACTSTTESLVAGARWQFSKQIDCPEDRITTKLDPPIAKPPPPDVAADPGRLAMYNKQVEGERLLGGSVDVTGCGQVARYHCKIGYGPTGEGRWDVYCTPQPSGKLGDFMTVATRTITLAAKLGVVVPGAARTITVVVPGGIGERAGFKVGDVLVALDHQPLTDTTDYQQALSGPPAPHVVTVQRGGEQTTVSVPAR